MEESITAWALGGSAFALTAGATALNAIFAFAIGPAILVIQLLSLISFGVNVLVTCTVGFMFIFYISSRRSTPFRRSKSLCWWLLIVSAVMSISACAVSLVTLVWITVRLNDLPSIIVQQYSQTILILWFAIWGTGVALQGALYGFIGSWIKKAFHTQAPDRRSLDFGIGQQHMEESKEVRPETRDTAKSFQSQDPTLASTPPRTPTGANFQSSLRSIKGRPTSSRAKLNQGNSARSSLEHPTGEAISTDNALDKWDTSSVHRDIRATLKSVGPVAVPGLETIPGSRPESPAKPLDGPFLPTSLHATSSDGATAVDWAPSSPMPNISSSSSSPPNFSRPTSRPASHNVSPPRFTTSLEEPRPIEELIHPLFRSSSPNPAPIATPGTMVTASPMAGQTISPRTVMRMRSGSMPAKPTMFKLFDAVSTDTSSAKSTGSGSPGPSIAEEQDLPPIIPSFVLSAGQRSSLVGYSNRKSDKGRPDSNHSQGSRLSRRASLG